MEPVSAYPVQLARKNQGWARKILTNLRLELKQHIPIGI